jgi:methylated-DNA-[protein]-cysteine S-methyltransferase
LSLVAQQLEEYFAKERREFSLPLEMSGTQFQRRVWDELSLIPYGTTISYGTLAQRIGHPRSSRAIGQANARNPIPIIVPCHRVVASNGLGGYAGGLAMKETLLQLEAR